MMSDSLKTAVDALEPTDDPSLFIAENGLRLRLRKIPQMLVVEAVQRLKAPEVPRSFDPDTGKHLDNPADPEYARARREYAYETAMVAMSAYFILGTRVEGELPPGVNPVESSEWVEMLEAVDPNIAIPPLGPRRYLAWLKYHALTGGDQNRLIDAVQRHSGMVAEVDVQTAQRTFRPVEARNADRGVPASDEVGLGIIDGIVVPGNGTGAGAEGSSGLRDVPVDEFPEPTGF